MFTNRYRRALVAGAVLAGSVIATPITTDAHGRSGRTVTVREGESIQAAIDDARPGTRIVVRGHHDENVWINKNGIHLIGRDGASMSLPDDPVTNPCEGFDPATGQTFAALVCVHPADVERVEPTPGSGLRNVTVKGLTLTGSTGDAISAIGTKNLHVRGNTIVDPGCDAIFVLFSDGFDIGHNEASGSQQCGGIRAIASNDGVVRDNTSTGHPFAGFEVADSTNVKLRRNTASDNCIGFVVQDALDPFGFGNADITAVHNTANANNRICYPLDPPGSFEFPVGATGIFVVGGSNVTVKRNTANDNVTDGPSITAGGITVFDAPDPADPNGPPISIVENVAIDHNTATGNSSAAGPVDLFMTATGTFASVKNNTCDVSLPDPGWCGGAPLSSRFAEGGALAGSTNGMSFAPDGTLWVANVFGATITQIDPETGAILDRLTADDSVWFPDDLVIAPDGTMYWTEIALGTLFKKPVGEQAFPLLPIPFGLNSANPVTLSDDGRLFAAGCYGAPPLNNSLVEIDPVNGGIINTLRADIAGCASNSMSWGDGVLYAPQPVTGEILGIDPDSGDISVVTSGWPVPIGTAVDSNGDLYALAQGVGEVVRVDVDNPDPANNRTVIAEIPVGWADNIAINADDRIFISSASDSVVAEVLADGSLRTVVDGQFQTPAGVAVIGDTLYMVNPQQVLGWDRGTRERTSTYRAAFGLSDFPAATFGVAWGDNIVVTSAISGQVGIWDPVAETLLAQTVLAGPGDAEPFQGDLMVHETQTGNVLRLDSDLNVIETIANVPGGVGLAAKGGDLFITDVVNGTILKLMNGGRVLATPQVVVDGLAVPEGLDIAGRHFYVVETGAQQLTRIDRWTGDRRVIASDLGFAEPPLPDVFPIGLQNNVVVAGDDIYVNADRANIIYEF